MSFAVFFQRLPLRLRLLFLFYLLFSKEQITSLESMQDFTPTSSLSATDGLPNSLVNNHVCAITGEFIYSAQDALIPGPESLAIQRFYSSGQSGGNFGCSWALNHQDSLCAYDAYLKKEEGFACCLYQRNGGRCQYVGLNSIRKKNQPTPMMLSLAKGWTNTATGQLSARSHIGNQKCIYLPAQDQFVCITPDQSIKTFVNSSEKKNMYRQVSEVKSTGNGFSYQKVFSNFFQPNMGYSQLPMWQISALHHPTKTLFSFANFDLKKTFKGHLLTLETSSGKKVHYEFFTHTYKTEEGDFNCFNENYFRSRYLHKIESPHFPSESFQYALKADGKHFHIYQCSFPDKRFIGVEYYNKGCNIIDGFETIKIEEKDDFRLDRVRYLKAPVGPDSTPVITHRFLYEGNVKTNEEGIKEVLDGRTDVFDAYFALTSYFYDKNHRIKKIKWYNAQRQLHRTQKYKWSPIGNLEGMFLYAGSDHLHSARLFQYDQVGNILAEEFYGHLTGFGSFPVLQDGIMHGEKARTTYAYSQDDRHLLMAKQLPNGTLILYDYKKGTDLKIAEWIQVEGLIKKRKFYEYDDFGCVIKSMEDDGQGILSTDLTGVTERRITRLSLTKTTPFGLPEQTDELFLDLQTGQEVLIRRIKTAYNADGKPVRQDYYGADGVYYYSLSWEYDLHGNATVERNALGEALFYQYDSNDNLIFKQTPSASFRYTYDFSNRLIKEEELHPSGKVFVTAHSYDLRGNKVATCDPYGNMTYYVYDDFSNLVCTILPPVLNENGVLENQQILRQHDILGKVIAETQGGYTTQTNYNSYGKPVKILYPDGTKEEFYYLVDGTLWWKVQRDGVKIEYITDYQGRVVKENTFSAAGVLLKQCSYHYNAFHLLSSTNAEGLTTFYFYDGAGRLMMEKEEDQVTTYAYDPLGRQNHVREWEQGFFRQHVKKYDWLDRIIEEKIESSLGELASYTAYAYDFDGNIIRLQEGEKVSSFIYDAKKRPLQKKDALGYSTYYTYDDGFINEGGQRVLQIKITDPLGYMTIQTHDAYGRLTRVERQNPWGVLLMRRELLYDACGNRACVMEVVTSQGQIQKVLKYQWQYNSMQEVMTIVEPEGKITRYGYNSLGQKAACLKPDGRWLYYAYDALGRMSNLTSSDKSVGYAYTYNLENQITLIQNLISGTRHRLLYDKKGQLIKENLEHEMALEYHYDAFGRVKSLKLPDESEIEYVHGVIDLKEIRRKKNGAHAYTHCNETRNLSGSVLKATLPGRAGQMHSTYDPLNRCTAIQAPGFEQTVHQYDASGKLLSYSEQGEQFNFSYDDLYQLSVEKGHSYCYNSFGNRLVKDGELAHFTEHNALLQQGNVYYGHDANGNRTSKLEQGQVTNYTYDALDRLTSVTLPDGKVIVYAYDAFNRRIAQKIGDHVSYFLYQGQEEIALWEEGQIKQLKVLGADTQGRAIAIEIEEKAYIPIHDLFGHVGCLLDLEGNIVETYRYSAFGEESRTDFINPWRYSAKRFDPHTGFYAFGLRDYDPKTGRWTTPDPSGFKDGLNLYAYLHNNPFTYIDFFGLTAEVKHNYEFDSFAANFRDTARPWSGLFGLLGILGTFSPWDTGMPRIISLKDDLGIPCIDNPNLMFSFTNGIGNSEKDFINTLMSLHELSGGYNIKGVYRPARGLFLDLYSAFRGLYFNECYGTVPEHHKLWDSFLEHAHPDARIFHTCHSDGVTHVRLSLETYPEELQKRIIAMPIAGASHIHESLCQAWHYRSKRDFVSYLDFMRIFKCSNTTTVLTPAPGAPYFDHSILSPTYKDVMHQHMQEYIKYSEGLK